LTLCLVLDKVVSVCVRRLSLSSSGVCSQVCTAESFLSVAAAGLTSLKTLWLGSGDHRLGLSTEQLQELGQQWPSLDTLRLSGFSPLQGFSGLGAFTGLTALSMKPGVGTGGVVTRCRVLSAISWGCWHPAVQQNLTHMRTLLLAVA
jgi:hypothetical protein